MPEGGVEVVEGVPWPDHRRGRSMKAYIIIEISIKDPEVYVRYMEQASSVVRQYNGRYLVRGGPVQGLTGGWNPERVIILEFDDAEQNASMEQFARIHGACSAEDTIH